ncbi:MAG: hypothetical protein K6V97_03820 [Actinomycetia bacterium]|nr:hypothetical protein [Actinomycetes bacterium]
MLAHPTFAQAYPQVTQRIAAQAAQEPAWRLWAIQGSRLWAAAPVLDATGLTLARRVAHQAAWTLDALCAALPADVFLWLWAAPAVTAAWQTWIQLATQVPSVAPTQTLQLTAGAHAALSRLQAWDPVLGTNAPADPGAVLTQVLQGLAVVPVTTPAQPAATPLKPVTVTADLSLVALATRELGDPNAWPAIVAANALRPPYISSRLWDVYGPPLAVWSVNAPANGPWPSVPPLTAGATTVTLNNIFPFWVQPGMVLVAEQPTATGRQQEVQTITAWNSDTLVATISPGWQASYQAGALLGLMLSPQQQLSQVLQPGQTLYVPQPGAIPADRPAPTDLYGTDLALDPTGQFVVTGTGDLATTSGPANVLGALARRLATALGGVPLQPTYGSRLADAVGLPVGQATALRSYVLQALRADPRVAGVPQVTVRVTGTVVQITAQIQIVGRPGAQTLATQVALT